jgi:hypothetical protein
MIGKSCKSASLLGAEAADRSLAAALSFFGSRTNSSCSCISRTSQLGSADYIQGGCSYS